jgi:hypothetical protein
MTTIEQPTPNLFKILPVEMQRNIISILNNDDLLNFRLCNKYIKETVNSHNPKKPIPGNPMKEWILYLIVRALVDSSYRYTEHPLFQGFKKSQKPIRLVPGDKYGEQIHSISEVLKILSGDFTFRIFNKEEALTQYILYLPFCSRHFSEQFSSKQFPIDKKPDDYKGDDDLYALIKLGEGCKITQEKLLMLIFNGATLVDEFRDAHVRAFLLFYFLATNRVSFEKLNDFVRHKTGSGWNEIELKNTNSARNNGRNNASSDGRNNASSDGRNNASSEYSDTQDWIKCFKHVKEEMVFYNKLAYMSEQSKTRILSDTLNDFRLEFQVNLGNLYTTVSNTDTEKIFNTEENTDIYALIDSENIDDFLNNFNKCSFSGGKPKSQPKVYVTYNKKRYVVRTGKQGGKHIIVDGQKKYIKTKKNI